MSFGALILLKSDGPNSAWEPIDGSHQCAVTEIRVEQHLDKQTSFAIRFQEDFEDQQALEAAQAQFAKSTGVAICVPNGPETVETPIPSSCAWSTDKSRTSSSTCASAARAHGSRSAGKTSARE